MKLSEASKTVAEFCGFWLLWLSENDVGVRGQRRLMHSLLVDRESLFTILSIHFAPHALACLQPLFHDVNGVVLTYV